MCKQKNDKSRERRDGSKRKKVLKSKVVPVVLDVRKTRCTETRGHVVILMLKWGKEFINKFIGRDLELLDEAPDGLEINEVRWLLQEARGLYKIGETVVI